MEVANLKTNQTPSPERVARDPVLFAQHFLRIQDKRMRVLPLRYNFFQLDYLSKRSSRDLILKPRQLGFTTCIQAELRRYEWTRAARTLTLGKDDENTTDLRNMADYYYDNLPEGFRPFRAINNATRTIYPDVGSRATIRTAGNRNSGRGGTNTHIHMSEAAFYADAGKIVASALQAGNPLWVVAESTPNGAMGWFYEEVQAALRGESVWKVHFYRWFDNPDYAIPLEPKERLTLDDTEKDLVKKHGLSHAQIKWRRLKVLEVRDLFPQEYPEDINECFLQSGLGVFQIPATQIYTPLEQSAIDGHYYVAGIDWGEDNDFTCMSVFDVTEHREVALYRANKESYAKYSKEIVALCKTWGIKKIIAERNAMGKSAVEHVQNAIQSEEWPINPKTGYPSTPVIQMFYTGVKSKVDIVSQFQIAIQEGVKLLDNKVANAELRAYVKSQTANQSWSYKAEKGHDDTVMARMLANKAAYELR